MKIAHAMSGVALGAAAAFVGTGCEERDDLGMDEEREVEQTASPATEAEESAEPAREAPQAEQPATEDPPSAAPGADEQAAGEAPEMVRLSSDASIDDTVRRFERGLSGSDKWRVLGTAELPGMQGQDESQLLILQPNLEQAMQPRQVLELPNEVLIHQDEGEQVYLSYLGPKPITQAGEPQEQDDELSKAAQDLRDAAQEAAGEQGPESQGEPGMEGQGEPGMEGQGEPGAERGMGAP
ncbi:MAG: hypothetical protein ACODAG_10305 [Myxococcota bacterium]